DGDGIFRARIVAGQDHEIAFLSSRLAHQRTLGAVAVPAASEYGDHTIGFQIARDRDSISERVVSVRVIDHDGERLTLVDALKPAGHGAAIGNAFGDDVRV